jgi:hypothetical protein
MNARPAAGHRDISRTGMLGPYVKPVPPPQNSFSHGLLWKCRVVMRQFRELAQQVLDGKIALHAAFNEASPPTLRSPEDDARCAQSGRLLKKPLQRPNAKL